MLQAASNALSPLESRNITLGAQHTSMRLEPEMWEALTEIARRENMTIHRLCSRVNAARRHPNRTSAMRVVIVAYFRLLATYSPPAPSLLDRILPP